MSEKKCGVVMTPQADGSIIFNAPINFVSANYAQDPENPLRYIPKYEPCRFRRLELKVLKCGKQTVNWTCKLTGEGISVAICRDCTKRELPDAES